MGRRGIFGLLTLALVVVVVELASLVGSRMVGPIVRRPPSREQFEQYVTRPVDFDIGWHSGISERAGGLRPRPSPAARERVCVQAFGDSFVFGHDVAEDATWAEALGHRLGCGVENFGAVAQGPDQALLVYQRAAPRREGVAILGYQSENIARVLTRDRALLYDGGIMTKARFVLDERGELRLLPAPKLTPADYEAYARSPRQFLGDDPLLEDDLSFRKPEPGFPHGLTLLRVALHPRIRTRVLGAFLDVEPWWAELYAEGHRLRALELSSAILQAFEREAVARGQRALVVLFPSSADIFWFRRSGRWTYAPLTEALGEAGVPTLDLGPGMVAGIGNADPCDFVCTRPELRTGHYTEAGHRLVAEILYDAIVQAGLLAR